jgi:hypothetical protein
MKNFTRIHKTSITLWAAFMLSACNSNPAKPTPLPAATTPEISATLPANSAGPATPAIAATATAAVPTANPCAASPDGTLKVCFLDLADGQTLAAKPGVPFKISAQASGAIVSGISLSADLGGYAQFVPNSANANPFQAEFSWTPGLGAGVYHLTLETLTADKSESATGTISVTVTGLSSTAPTPTLAPGAVYPEVIRKIQATFSNLFKLDVKAPAIARKFRPGVEDPWVSTAYIGNVLYDVELFADGHVETWATPVFPNTAVDLKTSYFKEPVCRPAGNYSMLVVFLDFGNLKVGKDELLADLASATADANARYAAYPSAGPGSAPILQIQTTGVVIPVPPEVKGKLITPAQIKKYAGVDPSAYQWIAQVDLDSASTFRYANGQTTEATSFGYAFHGCPAVQSQPNIQITIAAASELQGTGIQIEENRLTGVMLGHEVYHLFGYPASHSWACTSGPQIDQADACGISGAPALLLGWMDTDGDGVPEIMDSTPYGIVSP